MLAWQVTYEDGRRTSVLYVVSQVGLNKYYYNVILSGGNMSEYRLWNCL